jgi:hypothetical protein
MLRYCARQSVRAVTSRARGIARADVWTVGVADAAEWTTSGDLSLSAVRWIEELAHAGYLADPFLAQRDGTTAIMVEEFDEAGAQGIVSALVSTASGWQLCSGVVRPGVHASYPALVRDGDELYCVPETWEAGRVEAWRSIRFPSEWERSHVLVDAPVVDPTVFNMHGRWWLLGTLKDDEPDAKLYAWLADSFTGPWHPHPLNPVKIDVTSSRPAGMPFVHDGVLIRPAQDCSTAYGSGVVLNRIDRLDELDFREEPVGRVQSPAGRYESGTHTLNSFDGRFVIDGRRYGVSRHRMTRELRARLRKIGGSR